MRFAGIFAHNQVGLRTPFGVLTTYVLRATISPYFPQLGSLLRMVDQGDDT